MLTEMAAATDTLQAQAGQFITWIQLEVPEFRWALAHAFNGEIPGIGLLLAFFALFGWYFKRMTAINRELDGSVEAKESEAKAKVGMQN